MVEQLQFGILVNIKAATCPVAAKQLGKEICIAVYQKIMRF